MEHKKIEDIGKGRKKKKLITEERRKKRRKKNKKGRKEGRIHKEERE